jgi:light-regulated signal transduction histidine kinase (bacteriophytochrome)/CheY-like chemotaxis protein
MVRSLLTRLQQIDNLEKTLEDAVRGLSSFSGFDRVMIYQFDPNGDGEVKAEARSPHLEPFLGLRFPKWDIPNQVRDIMKRLPLRMIADVQGDPVHLMSQNPESQPLDLTSAACRGVSPIHCEYLSNMGVRSSMTLSIVVNDELWGLIAFHNEKPGQIDPNMRGAAELFAQFFSLQMDQRFEKMRNTARKIALSHQTALMNATEKAKNITDLMRDISGPFCQQLDASGMATLTEEGVSCYGVTPAPDIIKQICEALFANTTENVVPCESLADLKFGGGRCAGALALRLHENAQDAVVFFREEASISVTWAGAPEKHIVEEDDGPRLKPRGSFAAYKQSVKNKCKPWERHTILSANELRLTLAKADTALFRRLAKKEERQRSIYIAELNHRVRNMLALIRSISRRSRESSNSLESYAQALEQRITALAAAHDLATNEVTSGVDISAVFEIEAKPFVSDTKNQLFISGESFLMKAEAAPVFALVVHELMTNCVKHGAFSSAEGSVHISIQSQDDKIKIHWKERGGPKIMAPSKRGFGLELIEQAIPYELEGRSLVEFQADGLDVRLWLPSKIVERVSSDEFPNMDDVPSLFIRGREGVPRNVLVVEDSIMVALDTSDMLKKMGVETVEAAATVDQALSLIQVSPPDFAVLDVSLRETTSFAIAETLQSMDIPFCFVTGFGSDLDVPARFESETILTKPTDLETLGATMTKLYLPIK